MRETKTATPAEMRDLVAAMRTDDPNWFTYRNGTITPERLTAVLTAHISEQRRATIESVLDHRTENVAVIVEGMVDLGNVSAVMRTADGFGVQRMHSIDTAGKYKRSKRTTQGADKWIDRYRWNATPACYEALKADGYRIVAADVAEEATPIWDADLSGRSAIVFGNELEGLSEYARVSADEVVTIPMGGFTESFNISVAAALVLYEVVRQRQVKLGYHGDLTDDARARIRAVWYAKSVPNGRAIVEHELGKGQPSNETV